MNGRRLLDFIEVTRIEVEAELIEIVVVENRLGNELPTGFSQEGFRVCFKIPDKMWLAAWFGKKKDFEIS